MGNAEPADYAAYRRKHDAEAYGGEDGGDNTDPVDPVNP